MRAVSLRQGSRGRGLWIAVVAAASESRTLRARQNSSRLVAAYEARTGTSAALSIPPMSKSYTIVGTRAAAPNALASRLVPK